MSKYLLAFYPDGQVIWERQGNSDTWILVWTSSMAFGPKSALDGPPYGDRRYGGVKPISEEEALMYKLQ